jgi:ribosome-binding protein aMBF1 (putative translation factor)
VAAKHSQKRRRQKSVARTPARYRIRTAAVKPVEPGAGDAKPAEAKPQREFVQRFDRAARAEGTVQTVKSILEPAHAAVVDAFAKRGMSRDQLAQFAKVATDLVADLGKSGMKASEFTRLEAEAVSAQKQRWDACKRMLRKAVAGNPELERLFAAC